MNPLNKVTQCHECGSQALSWQTTSKASSDIPEGRLRSSEVKTLFVLGCDSCSETLKILSADQVAGSLTEHLQVRHTMPTLAMIAALGFGGDEALALGHAELSEDLLLKFQAALNACMQDSPAPFMHAVVVEGSESVHCEGSLSRCQDWADAWNSSASPSAGRAQVIELWRYPRVLAAHQPEHTDDEVADRFAAALKAKMAKSRAKGREGWNDPARTSGQTIAVELVQHLFKGNPGNILDLGCLAMMLHERNADPRMLADIARGIILQALLPERRDEAQAQATPVGFEQGWNEALQAVRTNMDLIGGSHG